jgi:hypothetical protein
MLLSKIAVPTISNFRRKFVYHESNILHLMKSIFANFERSN